MVTLDSIVISILAELKNTQNATIARIGKDDPFPLPRMIGVGNGVGIIVSRKIDELIALASHQLKSNDPSLARRVTDEEWNSTVRAAFGPPLAKIDLAESFQSNAKTVLNEVKTAIAQKASQYGRREFALGCTLFSNNTKVSPFAIGSVRFESRFDWLKRKHAEGEVSLISRRRIEGTWKDKKLAKRRASRDSMHEKSILDAIGGAPYICSVSTSGFAKEAGLGKALTAARLALSSISLLWQTPSKVLDGFNLAYDRALVLQRALSFVPGTITLSGSKLSHLPHGPYLRPGEWEKEFISSSDHFKVAGEILSYFVSPLESASRPKLMSALGQALLWFHEGCREPVTLMAIVKFSASMDALGGGKRSGGIRRILNARLGIKDTDPIRSGGPTMKETIDRIYSEGRSRTIHGTNDKLGHDWSTVRALAEQFARLCLVACFDWAAKNPRSDDPSLLKK